MPEPFETLVFVARLTREEKDNIFARAPAFPGSDLTTRLLSAVEDVCLDRLLLAEGCLAAARRLGRPAAGGVVEEECLRAAVSRAYYSAHHSVRAMALWQNKWDPDGHDQSLAVLEDMLKNNSFVGRSGLEAAVHGRVVEARTNRHIADYSPYDVQRKPPNVNPIGITAQAWQAAVDFNIQLAEEMLTAATKFVGS